MPRVAMAAAFVVGIVGVARGARADWCGSGSGGTQCYATLDECNSAIATCRDAVAHGWSGTCAAACEPTGADAQPPPPPPGGVGGDQGGQPLPPIHHFDPSDSYPFGRTVFNFAIGVGGAINLAKNEQLDPDNGITSKTYKPSNADFNLDAEIMVRTLRSFIVGGFFHSMGNSNLAYGGALRFVFVHEEESKSCNEAYVQLGYGGLTNQDSGRGSVYSLSLGMSIVSGDLFGIELASRFLFGSIDNFAPDKSGQPLSFSVREWELLSLRVLLGY